MARMQRNVSYRPYYVTIGGKQYFVRALNKNDAKYQGAKKAKIQDSLNETIYELELGATAERVVS